MTVCILILTLYESTVGIISETPVILYQCLVKRYECLDISSIENLVYIVDVKYFEVITI